MIGREKIGDRGLCAQTKSVCSGGRCKREDGGSCPHDAGHLCYKRTRTLRPCPDFPLLLYPLERESRLVDHRRIPYSGSIARFIPLTFS